LPAKKAALLGKHLVFQVNGRHASRLVLANRAVHVQRVAVAGVGVANHRDVDGVSNVFRVGHHLGHGDQANVGKAAFGGSAGTGHIHGLMSHVFGDASVQGIQHERSNDQLVRRQHLAQSASSFHDNNSSKSSLSLEFPLP
jgi:hypothetical protein